MGTPDVVPGANEQLLDGQAATAGGQLGEAQPAAGLDANGLGQQQNGTAAPNYEFRDEIDNLIESSMTEQIYTYECDFQNYSIAFRNRKDNKFQMAVSSYNTESMNNQVDIVDLNFQKPNDGFTKIHEFKHEFPPTKIMWIPDTEGTRKDILATTAEYLRVWEKQEETNTFKEHKILKNVSTS